MKQAIDMIVAAFKTASPLNVSTLPSRVVNIIYFVIALCWAVVELSCKIGISVPGVPCGG